MAKKYLSKYALTHDETFAGFQLTHMVHNVKKEIEKKMFWRLLPWALLVAFVVFIILVVLPRQLLGG